MKSLLTKILFSSIISVGVGFSFAERCFATLGADADSIVNDRTKLALDRSEPKKFSNFKAEEMVAKGLRVRQFVSPSGRVFALAWSGRVDSQLPQLLGSYSKDVQEYEQAHPKRAGRIPYRRVDAGRVVLEFWDTLRKVEGKAIVPALAPANVTAKDIQIK